MDSMFEDDISILTQEVLCQDEEWLDSPNTDLSSEMCSASHFALITAYDDIKNRLTGLERENSTLKRRLKMYEIKVRCMQGVSPSHSLSSPCLVIAKVGRPEQGRLKPQDLCQSLGWVAIVARPKMDGGGGWVVACD